MAGSHQPEHTDQVLQVTLNLSFHPYFLELFWEEKKNENNKPGRLKITKEGLGFMGKTAKLKRRFEGVKVIESFATQNSGERNNSTK